MANISQNRLKEIKNADLNVFGIFCNDYNREIHASEVSKELGLPQRSVLRNLDNLCLQGVLKFKRIGRNKIYSICWDSPIIYQFLVFAESFKAANFLLENPKLALILNEIDCGKIIFGSYAKGENNRNSDLDVVFLCKESERMKNILSRASVEIHPQYSALENLNNEKTLFLEIFRNHVILGDFDKVVKFFIEHGKN